MEDKRFKQKGPQKKNESSRKQKKIEEVPGGHYDEFGFYILPIGEGNFIDSLFHLVLIC